MLPSSKATNDQVEDELKRLLIAKGLDEKQIIGIFYETSPEEIKDILDESKKLGLDFIDYWNAKNVQIALEHNQSNPCIPLLEKVLSGQMSEYNQSGEEETAEALARKAKIARQIDAMDPQQPSLCAEALALGLDPKRITKDAEGLGLTNVEALKNAIHVANLKSIQISEAWEKIASEAVNKGYNDSEVLEITQARIRNPLKFWEQIQRLGFENAFMKIIGFLPSKGASSSSLTNNPIEHQFSEAKEESSVFPNSQGLPSLFDVDGHRIDDTKDPRDGGRVEAKGNPPPITEDSKVSSEEGPHAKAPEQNPQQKSPSPTIFDRIKELKSPSPQPCSEMDGYTLGPLAQLPQLSGKEIEQNLTRTQEVINEELAKQKEEEDLSEARRRSLYDNNLNEAFSKRIADLIANGLNPDDAQAVALLEFNEANITLDELLEPHETKAVDWGAGGGTDPMLEP